jgi:diaminohydroxyphosphoribosylaminopyrimidine deaminase/5-amino-6-(5-phosphoribosylamino)uracil reductase
VLLEGGATLAGGFAGQHLLDAVVGYHAPALLGAGPPVLDDAGIGSISEAIRLSVVDVSMIGSDVRVTSVVDRGGR